MRDALARTLYELARGDERVCVVVADISPAGAMDDLRRDFPGRFVNVGVAEQSMIGLAAGMAARGMRPFCYTIATFALFRAYEFIRCDLAYQRLPVTVVGMGAGLSYSTLGGTHQAVEDVAVAAACPGMEAVLAPCDPAEVAECTRWCAGRRAGGPVYMRIGKAGEPDISKIGEWVYGKLRWIIRRCNDGRSPPPLVLSYGPMIGTALDVAHLLGGADVASVPTLHPLDLEQDEVAGILGGSRKLLVVIEEAAGAPLYLRLAAEASKYGEWAPRMCSFALPTDFIHYHGSRAEALDRAGLTAEKIVARIEES